MKSLILSLIAVFFMVTPCLAEHRYQGTIVDIYDADTFTVEFDLGFNLTLTEPIRLLGLDTPELRTTNEKEKELGYEAKAFVEELILGKTFEVVVFERDKYGRPLIDLILPDGKTLTDTLIEKGYAYAYFGEKKKGWDDL